MDTATTQTRTHTGLEYGTPEVEIVSAYTDKQRNQCRERRRKKKGREWEREMRGGWRRLGRPVRLEEVLVRRPAGKWKKKGACRLPEASLGPSVLSFRRQVLH